MFFNFCHVSSQNTHVTQNGLHASQLSCTACKQQLGYFFVCCIRVTICVMHDSKKHASNASCDTHESVFLYAACKLTVVFCQRRIKACNEKAPQQNVIKCINTKKIIFCQVFTYPYSRWCFHRTNWMPSAIMAQGLDSTGTNYLTRLVAQCTHVLYHKAQLRNLHLNWGIGAPFLIADTMLSHFTISHHINTVGSANNLMC